MELCGARTKALGPLEAGADRLSAPALETLSDATSQSDALWAANVQYNWSAGDVQSLRGRRSLCLYERLLLLGGVGGWGGGWTGLFLKGGGVDPPPPKLVLSF